MLMMHNMLLIRHNMLLMGQEMLLDQAELTLASSNLHTQIKNRLVVLVRTKFQGEIRVSIRNSYIVYVKI